MTDESQLYRDLMRLKPEEWTPNAWAVQAGVSRTVWTDMRRHGNPSRRTLEKLLTAAGSSLAEFEALRIGEAAMPSGSGSLADRTQSWGPAALMPLPLIASRAGAPVDADGMTIAAIELNAASIIDRLPRPPTLAPDREAYAFSIVGKAMWPRFREGRRVAVSPGSKVSAGDDVVLTVRKDWTTGVALAVVGELVDAGEVRLRQFNPDTVYTIEASRVLALHKIAGELI